MTEISYHELESFLEKETARRPPSLPSVGLFYGEEVLYKKAMEKLVAAILGDLPRDIYFEPVEGLNENMPTALERINTYSLLSQSKIVAFTDARLFYSRQNMDRLWDKTAKACQAGEMKKAARFFMDLLSVQQLSLEDLQGASPETVLNPPGNEDDLAWVPAVLDYCRQNGLTVPAAVDPQNDLQMAIERGFPPSHHLMVTAALVDKRRTLYKTIREKGLVVDCTVPKGDRKADRTAQDTLLDAAVSEALAPYGKRMDPAARRALYDLTGFDLRMVASNAEKLVHFTGGRETIGVEDVRQTLRRTRQDPLYALTEAVSNRQLSPSLFYLDSLLTGGDFDHPLPLLAAVTNQMRRLLVAKDFTESAHGRAWHPGCSYPQFQSQVMPAVKAFDESLQAHLKTWGQALSAAPAAGPQGRRGKKKTALQSDLFLAGKGRSPYPIYKTLQKAERFTRSELLQIMQMLGDADRRLKRSGPTGRMVLEHAILAICQTGADVSSPGQNRPRPGGRKPRDSGR
jgi:DNA polymerase-3 subunit delta